MSADQTVAHQTVATRTSANTILITLLYFLGVTALSLLIGFTNAIYFKAINNLFHIDSRLFQAILFSSYLLVIGGPFVIWRPKFFGFQVGDSLSRWKLILIVTFVYAALIAVVLSQMPRTPFSGADWVVEMVVVPFTEELVFRGVILTGLWFLLCKIHPENKATILAIGLGGISFGLAHLNNIFYYPVPFVLLQVLNAIIMGLACGYLRLKAKSVYPAMFLHASINIIAILF
jgi:membrane protease YdiL (CAAX protease family)